MKSIIFSIGPTQANEKFCLLAQYNIQGEHLQRVADYSVVCGYKEKIVKRATTKDIQS